MRLLICTQKIDKNDPVLGFFHRWVEEFAKRCTEVIVVCLEEGSHDLPENVAVYSLGKERRTAPSVLYALRFRRLIKKHIAEYDAVFVHMNPEYVVLAGRYWRRRGKEIGLWYVHKSVTVWLRLALPMVDAAFTASPASLRLESPKVHVVGHGIDIARYSGALGPLHTPPRLVSVGRITPIKRLEIMIEAVRVLKDEGIHTQLTFIGAPTVSLDHAYEKRLRELVQTLGVTDNVSFKGAVPYGEMPKEYQQHDISINMAPTGGIDKAVLESMAAGLIVVVHNEAFGPYLGEYADKLLTIDSPKELAARLRALIKGDDTDTIRSALRDMVAKRASLEKVVGDILLHMGAET